MSYFSHKSTYVKKNILFVMSDIISDYIRHQNYVMSDSSTKMIDECNNPTLQFCV